MIYLLDTNVLSDAFEGRYGLRERIDREQEMHHVVISSITLFEVLRGRIARICTAADGAQLLRMVEWLRASEQFLSVFDVLPINDQVAAHFDRLKKAKKIKKPGQNDLLIACTALAYDATLVTRNTKDFQPIPNLKVENWAD